MKKEYIKPTSMDRDVYIQPILHVVSAACLTTGANNAATDGWNGGYEIGVNNGEIEDKTLDWDTDKGLWN